MLLKRIELVLAAINVLLHYVLVLVLKGIFYGEDKLEGVNLLQIIICYRKKVKIFAKA